MEKKNDLSVGHNRSIRACISDGYQLYVGNFYRIFRASWLAALLYAVVCGGATSYIISVYPRLLVVNAMGAEAVTAQAVWVVSTLIAMAVSMLLVLLVTAILFSYGVSLLSEHQATAGISKAPRWFGRFDGRALLRTLMALGWELLILVVVGVVLSAVAVVSQRFLGHYAGIALETIFAVAFIVMLLPLTYTLLAYLFTQKLSFASALKATYGYGMRRIGAIFMVGLVVGLVSLLLSAIIELPANILYLANMQSQAGLLQADPSGMPEYMNWMNLLVFTLAGFIQAYVQLSCLFPLYYLYHKLKWDNEQNKQHQNQIQ